MEKNLEEINEEFNNFMHRVNEVSAIVSKLNSPDDKLQAIGVRDADRLLNYKEIVDVDNVRTCVKQDRTVINRKAVEKVEEENPNTMSQQAFMDEVSRDAEKRYQDRRVRTERMETFKKQATIAFRRCEYEKALSCYNKAIEQIKDSPLLYNNRCLTHLRLGMYEKAIEDAETALKFNEDSLRSHLFIAKAYFHMDDAKAYAHTINEAKSRNPKKHDFIDDFIKELEWPRSVMTTE